MKCLCLKSKECDVFTENGDYIGTKMFTTGDICCYYGMNQNGGYVLGDENSNLKFHIKTCDNELFKIVDSEKHYQIELCFNKNQTNEFLRTIPSKSVKDVKYDSGKIMIIYEV